MARPSIKDLQQRNKLINSKLFTRDSNLYTLFEEQCEGIEKVDIPYRFMEQCFFRHYEPLPSRRSSVAEWKTLEGEYNQSLAENENSEIVYIVPNYQALNELNYDGFAAEYYMKIWDLFGVDFDFPDELYNNANYHVETTIESFLLTTVIGNKFIEARGDTFENIYGDNSVINVEYLLKGYYGFQLSEEDKQAILREIEKEYHGEFSDEVIERKPQKIFVYRARNPWKIYNEGRGKNDVSKNIFIELDLTKPMEELMADIEKIKMDFNQNPSTFPSIYELFGAEIKPYISDFKESAVYKETRTSKPLFGRLADILFIYDCRKVGLHEDYTVEEINRYWKEVKKISDGGFYSYREYSDIGIEYIDEEKYKCFLSGVNPNNY